MGAILYIVSVHAAQILHPDCDLKPCPPFTAVCEETSTVTLVLFFLFVFFVCLFFQVFAKDSLIKNIFEEEKTLIEHGFFLWKIVQYLVYVGQDEDFKQTMKSVRKSAISLQPGNHKPLK